MSNSRNFPVKTGLDIIRQENFADITGMRVGLVVNQASVDFALNHAADIFTGCKNLRLAALFGPQHGIMGTTQDNMIEWQGYKDPRLGIPVYSLYGEHRKPTAEMLEGLDGLVLDLPDVGARYYTFIWTAKLCLEACADKKIPLIILDRPNPIGGIHLEGPGMDKNYRSFVGLYEIIVRHGMTMGEILRLINSEENIGADLRVIEMEGWKRSMHYSNTGLPWVLPSPNMPTLDTALVYPGGCLLEATNISEGRGTCRPFELVGAPFIDSQNLTEELKKYNLPGVFFRPTGFQPTFNKFAGKICAGCQIHVKDPDNFLAVKTTMALIFAIKSLYPEDFAWKNPPYEYEYEKMPIDILWGSDQFRKTVDNNPSPDSMKILEKKMYQEVKEFGKIRQKYLLY